MIKNILFYLSRFPGYGGIERVTTVLCDALNEERTYNIYIVSRIQQDKEKLTYCLNKNISFRTLDEIPSLSQYIQEKNINTIVYQDSFDIDFLIIKKSTKNLCIQKIAVIHNTPNAFELTLDCEVQGNWTLKNRLRKLKTKWDFAKKTKSILHWSDRLILLSENYKPILASIVGHHACHKISVINNPLTIDMPKGVNEKKHKLCLFIGRLHTQKGIHFLMEIWKEIERMNPDWHLKIVGDGPERCFIEEYINKKNIKNISLEGFKTNVSSYYNEGQIFLMTSIFEGWPLTLFEAMAYGCIPITFNSFAAAAEIIDDGLNGILIPPFDSKSYIKSLSMLIGDYDNRIKMSKAAQYKASLFSIERIKKQWIEIL